MTPIPARAEWDDAGRTRPASRPEQPPHARSAGVILIVDDTADTRELYGMYFRSRGYIARTAHDGMSGIEAALRLRPDVIVMDLSMPGLDGIAATRRLKREPRTRHIPLIILTGYPMRAIQDGALEAGAEGFLTKPCLPEDLEQHVRRLLGKVLPE
jgi:two-component system, cell cycle response regulator DivK